MTLLIPFLRMRRGARAARRAHHGAYTRGQPRRCLAQARSVRALGQTIQQSEVQKPELCRVLVSIPDFIWYRICEGLDDQVMLNLAHQQPPCLVQLILQPPFLYTLAIIKGLREMTTRERARRVLWASRSVSPPLLTAHGGQ